MRAALVKRLANCRASPFEVQLPMAIQGLN
jgi:hypothetical protein